MASEEKVLAAIGRDGRGLRVVFSRTGDRWGHAIEWIDGERAKTLWRSVEGSAHDDWPASPALQDLSLEQLPDGRTVIFLVGKAGSSHWSASVESMADPPQLIFDIACRHGAAAPRLGSTYSHAGQVAESETALLRSELEGSTIYMLPDQVIVTPQIVASMKALQTTRWKYSVYRGELSHQR